VPHKHNYFVIISVKNGSGTHLVDLAKYELKENTIYCLTPGQIHLLKADPGIDGCVISFRSEFLCLTEENFDLLFNCGLFYTFSQAPVIDITEDIRQELEDLSLKMQKEYESFFLLRAEILRGYLKILLIYLTRQFEKSKGGLQKARNIELVKSFFTLLENDFVTKKMVADFAAELTVTPNYLNEIVKKVSGIPCFRSYQTTRCTGSQTSGRLFRCKHERNSIQFRVR